jgi:hypothetical protein
MKPKARWTRAIVAASTVDVPLPWSRIRPPRPGALGLRA